MRQPKSLFNRACEFINERQRGDSFLTKDYIAAIGQYENVTSWKKYNKNKHYNCHQYKGYLKKAGFISQVKRGEWKIEEYIPHWFDFGHLSILLGYYKWDSKTRKNITTYKGMSKQDILDRLNNPGAEIIAAHRKLHQKKAMNILQNSTYGAYAKPGIVEMEINQLNDKNYNSTVNKIVNTNGSEDLSSSKIELATRDIDRALNLTENLSRLHSAADLLRNVDLSDQFMRARVYNVLVLTQDLAKAVQEYRDFVINN
jgi:hypothetical protein